MKVCPVWVILALIKYSLQLWNILFINIFGELNRPFLNSDLRVLRRISCHGRNYSQPYFFKRNQSSDNRSHGFGAKFLLKKLSASDFSYERKSAFRLPLCKLITCCQMNSVACTLKMSCVPEDVRKILYKGEPMYQLWVLLLIRILTVSRNYYIVQQKIKVVHPLDNFSYLLTRVVYLCCKIYPPSCP